jgi:hypothetical protein
LRRTYWAAFLTPKKKYWKNTSSFAPLAEQPLISKWFSPQECAKLWRKPGRSATGWHGFGLFLRPASLWRGRLPL